MLQNTYMDDLKYLFLQVARAAYEDVHGSSGHQPDRWQTIIAIGNNSVKNVYIFFRAKTGN